MRRRPVVQAYAVEHSRRELGNGDCDCSAGSSSGPVDRMTTGVTLDVRLARRREVVLLTHATSFLDRLRGLVGRPPPAPGAGLWIEPCSAVHSFGMRHPIDLVFVDRRGQVIAVRPRLIPFRAAACYGARATVEMAAGEVARLGIAPGSRLVPIHVGSAFSTDQEDSAMNPHTSASASTETAEVPGNAVDAASDAAATTSSAAVSDPAAAVTGEPAIASSGKRGSASSHKPASEAFTTRRGASRPARAAAIAAVAAASMISANAKADAAANMNLGYDFLDEIAGEQAPSVLPGNGMRDPSEPASEESESLSAAAPLEAGTSRAPDAESKSTPASPDPVEVSVRLSEAEGLYREARYDEAQRAFSAIVAADPGHAHAWLRIGNLMHRKRNWFDALSAYRKAARPQADHAIREKAVYNIALLNLELARHALRRLEKIRNEAIGTGGPLPKAGISDASFRQLTDRLGHAYASVAAAHRSDRDARPVAAVPSSSTAAAADAARSAPMAAPAPAPGPRTPKPLPLDRPVEVEIRQGGGAR